MGQSDIPFSNTARNLCLIASSLSFIASFFFYYYLTIFLHLKKTISCRKRLCFLVLRRIGKYISRDLLYFIHFTSRCSLIPLSLSLFLFYFYFNFYFDSQLALMEQVNELCQLAYPEIRRTGSFLQYHSCEATKILLFSLVLSCVPDYCKALLRFSLIKLKA